MATKDLEAQESARVHELQGSNQELEDTEQALSRQIASERDSITVAGSSTNHQHDDKLSDQSSRPITHALEALLGGLEPAEELPLPPTTESTAGTTIALAADMLGNGLLNESTSTEALADQTPPGGHIGSITETISSRTLPATASTSTALLIPRNMQEHTSNALPEQVEASRMLIPGLGLLQTVPGAASQAQHMPVVGEATAMVHATNELMVDNNETPTESITQAIVDADMKIGTSPVAETAIPILDDTPSSNQDQAMEVDNQEPSGETTREDNKASDQVPGMPGLLSQESKDDVEDQSKPTILDDDAIRGKDTQMTDVVNHMSDQAAESTVQTQARQQDGNGEGPEWEVDSSPIESSSDDSSSDDSSSEESDEGDNAYKLLSPEEQARILMKGDGDSDDEDGKGKGAGGQLRTKNEVPDVVIPKPDVVILENMPITQLGAVEQIVDNILLIKANVTGEYKVLESGSVLCLADRNVIGVVAETIGRVQQPFYSVLFTNVADLKAAGLSTGVQIFYSEQHSTFVFTQALKAIKGSDASNLHDEEVGDEEMEFSDDEAEAEHKRRVKQKRMDKRGGKQQINGSTRGGHPRQQQQQQHAPYNASQGISYDDNDDGPYTPLARPASYASTVGRSEAPEEGAYSGHQNHNNHEQRDQFRGRGRGDRGRGRGERGRGRGSYQDRRNGSGFSMPPQPQPSPLHTSPSPTSFSQPLFQPQNFPHSTNSATPMPPPNFYQNPPMQQYPPAQVPAWPQFQPQNYPPNPYQTQPNAQGNWPGVPLSGLPGGAFVNPAFFNQNNQAGNAPAGPWQQPNQRGGNSNRGR